MKRSLSALFVLLLLSPGESAWAQNDVQVLGDAVLTPADIAEGASVLYMIRFQNMGEDTAHQVVIYDTLDARLDPSTLNMVSASHGYAFLHDGNNNLRWYFEEINLPGRAIDPAHSFGFIMFSVRPLPFIESGQVITNRACIAFAPIEHVCTNEAAVWIDEGASVADPVSTEVEYLVVPNPNYGEFVVQPTSGKTAAAEWWISDVTGKIIWDGASTDMASVDQQVRLERPAPGLYLLWIKSEGRLQVEQFAIIR
jgi:uncharacterized repeat protein (TIGR01451 family)